MLKKQTLKLVSTLLVGVLSFLFIKPTFVQAVAGNTELSLFVTGENVETSTKVNKKGIRQIKYTHKGKEYVITDSNYPNADPKSDGEYIVWMAQTGSTWQIFLHHISSGRTIQLTTSGNNVNPSISGSNVAWEGNVNGTWQAFVFDGVKTIQITSGSSPSMDVGVDGDYVVYATKVSDEDDGWIVNLYDISSGTIKLLTPDGYGYSPSISGGIVTWTVVKEGKGIQSSYNTNPEASGGEEEVVVMETGATEPAEAPVVEESTKSEVEAEGESGEEILDAEESIESEIIDEPEEVTEEEIKEELGIVSTDEEEEVVEEEISSDSSGSVEDEEEVVPDENADVEEATDSEEVTAD